MCSSIHFSSISSCSGGYPTAPSTPNPPALLTATTTSRQWVNAKIGNSMLSSSQMGVCMAAPQWAESRTETCSSLVPVRGAVASWGYDDYSAMSCTKDTSLPSGSATSTTLTRSAMTTGSLAVMPAPSTSAI